MNESVAVSDTCSSNVWVNIVYCSIGVVITLESMLTVAVIKRTQSLKNITNLFVMSLAVIDTLVGLIDTLAGVVFAILNPSNPAFRQVYLAIVTLFLGATMCAYMHITALAIDRYLYIAHPYFYRTHVREELILKIILGLWCLMLLYMLATVLSMRKSVFCLISDVITLEILYVTGYLSLLLLLLTSLAYFRIAAVSLRHRRCIASLNVVVLPSASTNCQDSTKVSVSADSRTDMLKTVRFFLVMTSSFVAMMLPAVICTFMYRFGININDNLLNVMTLLPTVQSGFNFFINIFMNSDFRQAVKTFLMCLGKS